MPFSLVTGGAGFIGSHLVDALLLEGHRVRVFDNLSTGNVANLAHAKKRIDWMEGDVRDLQAVRQAVRDVEFIFHHAAIPHVSRSVVDPMVSHEVCATGTLHVLLAAHEAGVGRVICAGSASVYGDGANGARQECEAALPGSPYAVASLAAEHYCVAFTHVHGLETVRLRYFNVFGPRQSANQPDAAVVPLFLTSMLDGRRPVIHGDGLQTRDFTYIDDVVQANLLAAGAPRVSGRVYNVACGRATAILDLTERINTILGTEIRPIHTPARPGDIRHSRANVARAQADLGYCPCTDLEQSLRRCLDYYAVRSKSRRRAAKRLCPAS